MNKRMNKNIDNIIKKLKKEVPKKQTSMSDALNKTLVHPVFRERDMRQEAIDMGSHGAKEYFGGSDGRTV